MASSCLPLTKNRNKIKGGLQKFMLGKQVDFSVS